jgi:competence protein ComEC
MYLFAFIIGIFARDFFCPLFFFIFLLPLTLKQCLFIILCFASGWGWILIHEDHLKPHFVPDTSKLHCFEGTVIQFPRHSNIFNRYVFQIYKVDGKTNQLNLMVDVPLIEKSLYLGESYQWRGRYWQRNPVSNVGGLSAWYLDKNRHIDGYSQVGFHSLHRLDLYASQNILNRLKNWIYQNAYLHFQDEQIRSVFLTLVLGIGSELSVADWQLFKNTGTAHLMVVSGAHLSLVMGLVSVLVERTWRLSGLACIWIPAKRIGSVLSLLFGFAYALISGLGVPVQRAWLMFFFKWYRYIGYFRISSWQAFRWSLWFILILEPHAVWQPGTYLSYIAVAIFMYVSSLPLESKKIKAVLSQCLCVLGMAPLTCYWFGYIPILGIFANAIAIPWVSWLILPLAGLVCLSFSVHSSILEKLFSLATQWMYMFLQQISLLNGLNIEWHWSDTPSVWIVLLGLMVGFWIPMHAMLRYMILLIFICIWPHPYQLPHGAFKADILDVGQGLSVLIATSSHHLLFDTGGRGMYQNVLKPYLKHQQVKVIDKMVISHPDLDHRAAYPEILQDFPDLNLIVDDKRFYHAGQNCSDTSNWCWDGVCFQFIQYQVKHHSKNNNSCVLQVSNHQYQLLLTGDIERLAEYEILHQHHATIQSTVMMVPHHGSLTSSSYWFLDRVKPKLAVLSVAQSNAYHLPSLNILKRYEQFHIPVISTAQQGMISLWFMQKQFKVSTWKNHRWIDEIF